MIALQHFRNDKIIDKFIDVPTDFILIMTYSGKHMEQRTGKFGEVKNEILIRYYSPS